MILSTIKSTIAAALVISGSAFAQDEGGPVKYENAEYFSMTNVDFKPGKAERAFEIIREHFMKASEAASLPEPYALHFKTGEWDAAFIWKLESGPADLEWYRSPNDIKWMEALAKQEGSKEAAGKLMEEWNSLIARSSGTFGHWHKKPEKK
jgi:hypothetical protein